MLCRECDPHRFLPRGEQRVSDSPAAHLGSYVRVPGTIREPGMCSLQERTTLGWCLPRDSENQSMRKRLAKMVCVRRGGGHI